MILARLGIPVAEADSVLAWNSYGLSVAISELVMLVDVIVLMTWGVWRNESGNGKEVAWND